MAAANLAENIFKTSTAKSADIPVQHLDYEYINTCNNGKELEKILKVLRSGKEGRWHDLERHCEKKLAAVFPKSKLLRISTQLLRPGALDDESKNELDSDMSSWLNSMSERDDHLKKRENLTPAGPVPDIRQTGTVRPNSTSSTTEPEGPNPDRINSYDYRAWDKYDPDAECEKVDVGQPKVQKKAQKPQPTQKPTVHSEVLGDDVTKEMGAEREKDKGNEAFKAGDYQESINYYSNSIDIFPLTATYNNRGLAKLKLERYSKAIDDFNTVLAQEPDNVKALLRRSDGREKIGQIKEAHGDLERSVIVDDKNKRAKQLLEEFKDRHKKLLTKGGKRMKIVESSDEEDEEVATPPPATKETVATPTPARSQASVATPTPTTKEEVVATPPPTTPAVATPPPTTPDNSCTRDDAADNQIEIIPLTQEVLRLKEEATKLFTNGNYVDAVDKYTTCVNQLDKSKPGTGYHHSLLLSNRAACKLKMGECSACIKDCNLSLEINPRLFKSVLRRAIAYENIENHKKAYEDYRLTIVMDPTQVTAHQGVSRLSKVLQDKFGANWRQQVSGHSNRPSGPTFVDKISPAETSPTKQGPTPQKSTPPQQSTASREDAKKKEVPPSKPAPTKPSAAPTKPAPTKPSAATSKPSPTPAAPSKPSPAASKPTPNKPAPKPSPVPSATPEKAPKAAETPKPAPTPKPTQPPKTTPSPPKTTPTTPPKTNRMPTRQEQYAKFKEQGNKQVAKQDYREAIKCYEKCITLDKDLVPAHLNLALCHLKLNNHKKAVECADKVLSKEPHNIKALYRRAAANKELNNYPASAKDLKLLVEKDKDNKQAIQLLDQVKKLWSAQLRGMQQNKAAPPKGKKIPIVTTDSDSESDEAPQPKSQPKQPKPQQPKPQQTKPQPTKPQAQPAPKPAPQQQPAPAKPDTRSEPEQVGRGKRRDQSGTSQPQQPTAFSFLQHWTSYKKRKDIVEFAKVLEACDVNSFPKIFSSSIDADMVIAIVDAVDKYFIPNNLHTQAIGILQAVTKVQRFDVMTLLMSVSDKTTISSVISKLHGDKPSLQKLLERFV